MDYITICSLAFMVFILMNDFKRDKGLQKKAKIYHSILLTPLIFSYADAIYLLPKVFLNLEYVKNQFSVDVGIFPGTVNLIFFFLNLVLSAAVLIFAFQMTRREDRGRKRFLSVLPFFALISVFNFYRGWITTPEGLVLNDMSILFIATLIVGGIAFVYYKVYSSKWMIAFFDIEPEADVTKNTAENLE